MLKLIKAGIYGLLVLIVVNNYSYSQPNISLDVTVGTDVSLGACAGTDSITIDPGMDVNFCYTVTNTGTTTFDTQNLTTDVFGDLIINSPESLAPTESIQFNDTETISSLVDLSATWSASEGSNVTTVTTSDDVGGPVYDYVDISSTGTAMGLAEGDEVGLTLDFQFSMLGLTSDEILIGNNGAIRLGRLTGLISFSNKDLNLSATYDTDNYTYTIAPYWDDYGDQTGDVYYETQGTTPNRIFIVQWQNRPRFNGTGSVSFQLKLFETSNEIQFHYLDAQFENAAFDFGLSATVGLSNNLVEDAVQFSYNTASISDSFAISFMPPFLNVSEATNTVTVIVNTPDINIIQESINFSENPDVSNSSQDLVIENVGTYVLNWTIEEGASARRFEKLANVFSIGVTGDIANAHAAPTLSSPTTETVNQNKTLLGSSLIAYALRIFPDNPQTFVNLDASTGALLSELNTSADYDELYAADFVNGDYSTLYALRNVPSKQLIKIDTATGGVTVVGSASAIGIEFWSGMTWDPVTGNMYALSTSGINSTLFTIDLTTGSTSVIGTVGAALIIDVAADIDGNLYGISIETDQLIGISKTLGSGALIGPTNYDSSFAQGMDFDLGTNTLYWSTCTFNAEIECGLLRTVNIATGNSTLVGQIGSVGTEYAALAIANDISCDNDVSWLDIASTSGSTESAMSSSIAISVNTTGLTVGDYMANLCVRSDDLDQPVKIVPVNLNVNDVIFTNGFEQ